jgi:hypothetical protein
MNADLVGLIGFIVVMAILLGVLLPLLPNVEQFVPEFLDQGNVKKTAKTGSSSYDQETNHFKLTPPVPEPIDGLQTPFRVNMFNSYTL